MSTQTLHAPQRLETCDINSIRNLLPYDWRKQIADHTGLTPRQVSETFYLRTTNPTHNQLVWSAIKKTLVGLCQHTLAEKAQHRIQATCITTQMPSTCQP